MNRFFLTTGILLLFAAKTLAQNLVPNASFEQADSLPCSVISGNVGDFWIEDYLIGWSSPTGGTSDIYSSLLPDSCYVNPVRLNIAARTGSNMAGIITSEIGGRYREYLQIPLTQPLVQGKSYYAEMYVLLEASTSYASNNLGMHFSDRPINESKEFREVLPFTPQINQEEIVYSSRDWQKITGCFVADTDATHLLIGNFFDSAQTVVDPRAGQDFVRSYYFIDDVSVIEVHALPEGILGNDTTLCAGSSLVLNAYIEGATYQWDNATREPTQQVRAADTYWVDITLGGCTYRDSINVSYESNVTLGRDTVLCYGESLQLQVSHPTGVYAWSNGSTAAVINVTEPGTYWVSIPSAYCLLTDTITVHYAECPGMIPNVFTPGNDDKNETFYIENISNRQWQLRIFNRWGKEVYASDNYQNNWTGEGLPAGVYFYELRGSAAGRTYKGWVQLLREAQSSQQPVR